jgi:predicted DNA-binding mobile mystery protein A
MTKLRTAATARSHLDDRFAQMGSVQLFTPPVKGWIRAIREGLGMTSTQLAARLGIKLPSMTHIEHSEQQGTIGLATLRRAAAALDCTLVYALVPNKPLATVVWDRARAVALKRLAPIEHSMKLEDQQAKITPQQIDAFITDLDPRILWDDA